MNSSPRSFVVKVFESSLDEGCSHHAAVMEAYTELLGGKNNACEHCVNEKLKVVKTEDKELYTQLKRMHIYGILL